MPYDDSFYKRYDEYLQDPVVRRQHRRGVGLLETEWSEIWNETRPPRVVDLGCGRSCEFATHYTCKTYTGIDRGPRKGVRLPKGGQYLQADYRQRSRTLVKHLDQAEVVVSLFSTEITANLHENRRYYDWIFENAPHLRAMLVAGFYYRSMPYVNPVNETGDVQSWQTLFPPDQGGHCSFRETARTVLHVPSDMFASDVYEVWRLLTR